MSKMSLLFDPHQDVFACRVPCTVLPCLNCVVKTDKPLNATNDDIYGPASLEEDEFDEDAYLGYKDGFDDNGGWEDNPFEGPANPDY